MAYGLLGVVAISTLALICHGGGLKGGERKEREAIGSNESKKNERLMEEGTGRADTAE